MIIFDIDGTLCFDRHSIDRPVLDALERASRDITIAFSSARHPRDTYPLLTPSLRATSYVFGCNGAICVRDSSIVYKKSLPSSIVNAIVVAADDNGCPYLIDESRNFVKSTTWHPLHDAIRENALGGASPLNPISNDDIVKILLLPLTVQMRDAVLATCNVLIDIEIHRHSDLSFDVTSIGINKHSGMLDATLAHTDYACFGNDDNDIPLFKHSYYAVQVGSNAMLRKFAARQISADVGRPDELIDAINEITYAEAQRMRKIGDATAQTR